jgi:hypothetical protein
VPAHFGLHPVGQREGGLIGIGKFGEIKGCGAAMSFAPGQISSSVSGIESLRKLSIITRCRAPDCSMKYLISPGFRKVFTGTTAAPMRIAAKAATTHSAVLVIHTTTRSPRRTPMLARPAENERVRTSSSA